MTEVLDFNNVAPFKPPERDEGRVDRIRAGLAANAESFVAWLYPTAYFTRHTAHVGDTNGNPGSSLQIETKGAKAGVWKDFADPSQKGGDLIALYQAKQRISFPDALDHLAEWLGQGARPEVDYERRQRVSKAKRFERALGQHTGLWHYTDAHSTIIASVFRYDPEDGGKEFLPWDAVSRRYGFPDIRPIYNLPGVLSASRVVFCEGEKSAQALIDLGVCATSVMGGCNSPLDRTDLSALKGKEVLLWADADDAGRKFMAAVAMALKELDATVRYVSPPEGAEKGWDAADAVADGVDIGSLLDGPQKAPEPALPYFWFEDAAPVLDANDFVEGLLTSGAMSVVYGPSNCGKTFFILDLALHVAQGEKWRGKDIDRGAVVYLSLEGSQGIRNRIAAFRSHYELDGLCLPFAVMPKPVNLLDDEADVASVIQLVEHVAETQKLPVRMVIIDTLSRAMAGGNENSSEDMTALIGNCDRIRNHTGAHVCVIHHSGKDEAKGARGHSSLRAATDTEIEITADTALKISNVRVAKQRDLDAGEPFAFTLKSIELGSNARGKPVTSCIVEAVEPAEADTRERTQLSPKQEDALSCLINALNVHGTDHEGSAPMPRTRVGALDDWRARMRELGVLDRTQDNLARSQFSKLKQALEKKGVIECWDGMVWLRAP